MADLDELIRGAIDMHMHTAPDTMPMRLDALEAARQARDVGMRAIVIKNHFFTTAPLATIVNQLVPEISVFGGLCLDYEVGGVNHHALQSAADLGAKIVWMATLSATNSRKKMQESLGIQLEGEGFTILDENGQLIPEIPKILDIVKKQDMVLASGHISPPEIMALFDEALKAGIKKLVVTHVSNSEVVSETLSVAQQQELTARGVYMEHTGADIMPCDFGHDPNEMVAMIKAVGAEHCILSSDMGMLKGMYPAEGLRVFVSALIARGITAEEIELMIKVNPARLLGLD